MPAIINLPGLSLFRFALGSAPEADFEAEAHLRWVLESYQARRDEQWRVPPATGGILLTRFYYEAVGSGSSSALAPILLAFGFYGTLVNYARHVASEQLGSPSSPVAAAAARALGSFDDPSQIAALAVGLGSADAAVNRQCFSSIARLARPSDMPLLEAAAAGNPERESMLEVTRRRQGATASGDVTEYLRATLSHAAFYEDLVGTAKFALKELTALFVADGALDEASRARCVRVLGLARLRSSGVASSALRFALDDQTPRFFRLECVRYLGRVQARVADRLCLLLDDADKEIVRTTLVALGEIADGTALGRVLNAYDAHGGDLRAEVELAAWRMSSSVDDESYAAWAAADRDLTPHSVYFFEQGLALQLPEVQLVGLLTHSETLVRREAALLLGISGTAAAAAPLANLLVSEQDELTRKVAERARRLAATRTAPPP